LHPDIACVTSIDADHFRYICVIKSAIEESFREFANKVEDKTKLFVPKGLPLEGMTVGIDEQATYTACNIHIENGYYVFNVQTPVEVIKNLQFGLPGQT